MNKIGLFLLLALLLSISVTPASAVSPYTTWTLGPGGEPFPIQDAYTALDEMILPVSSPEDMFVAPDGFLYLADTGNGRIIKLDAAFQIVAEFGLDVLQAPTGIYVDEAGTLYIADSGSNTIVILDHEGNLINQFGRPTEPLFGATRQFLPRKITVDARQNLYIVSEGSVDGLVMLNTNGNFIGYFGANTADMSLRMILQRMFLNDEQLAQFIRNEAASPSNVTIDSESLVYTVTSGTNRFEGIARFTVSGRNLMEGQYGSPTFRDIDVSRNGLMIAVDSEGTIYEYTLDGLLLFVFGAPDLGDQRLGLLSDPTAIAYVDDRLYVLDRDKNAIVVYTVTDFAHRLHEGVRLYMNGFYAEARPYFEEVLNYNGLIIMAYQALADAAYIEGDYASALQDYRYSEDRRGYSEAYWELRNAVLQRYLGGALMVMVGAWVVQGTFGRLERRYKWLEPLRQWMRGLQKFRLIDDFAFMFRFIRQPADSFYYIKYKLRGSLRFALLIYAWIVVVRVLLLYVSGFVFSPYSTTWQINPEMEVVYTVVPIVIWIAANYLVATISNGEGSLRQVTIGSAYSLFPYVLFALPIALISNVLTLNEVFLYEFSNQLIVFWCAIMLLIMVKEIHNYSFNETLRNLLLTLFTMAMFLLTAYILYVLFSQLYEFVLSIIQEVGLRA
jgi:tetratricopeptide (TPR) repeat protein